MDALYREPATMLLAGRKHIYKLLQKLWIAPPEAEQIKLLHDPSLEILLDLMSPSEELNLFQIFQPLKDGQLAFIQDEECYLTMLAEEYTALVYGDEDKPVSLYAVSYLNLPKEEMEEELREVQATYERYGAFSAESLIIDTHIAMEFGFMAHVCALAQQAIEVGNDERAMLLLEEQEWFLNDHMLHWLPKWYEQIHDGHGHFYKNLAEFTNAFLKADKFGIESVLDLI